MERKTLLRELKIQEIVYTSLGSWKNDPKWIREKSEAYNKCDKLRKELYDKN